MTRPRLTVRDDRRRAIIQAAGEGAIIGALRRELTDRQQARVAGLLAEAAEEMAG